MTEINYTQRFNQNIVSFFQKALFSGRYSFDTTRFFLRTCLDQRRAVNKRAIFEKQGLHVPPLMILSITNQCNLNCLGCYAHAIHPAAEAEMDDARLLTLGAEADELGISIILVAGGEPLMRPIFLELAKKYPHTLFLVFTNGLLLNESLIRQFKTTRNLVPILSLEGQQNETDLRRGVGVFKMVEKKMVLLRDAGLVFGTSLTLTRTNFDLITAVEFQNNLHELGSQVSIFVDYVPVNPETTSLVLTAEQKRSESTWREQLIKKVPGLFVSLPGDEEYYGGCLAGGRGFIHINPQGKLEACPFAPFSDTNIEEMSLKEALSSPLMETIRENANKLNETHGGCTLWENRAWVLSQMNNLPAEPGKG